MDKRCHSGTERAALFIHSEMGPDGRRGTVDSGKRTTARPNDCESGGCAEIGPAGAGDLFAAADGGSRPGVLKGVGRLARPGDDRPAGGRGPGPAPASRSGPEPAPGAGRPTGADAGSEPGGGSGAVTRPEPGPESGRGSARWPGPGPGVAAGPDPAVRATAVAAVGGALVAWWPAFTLGAYGVVFFEDVLRLWAVSTALLLTALLVGGRRHGTRRWAVLALPSLWVGVAIGLPSGGGGVAGRLLFAVAAVLSVLGTPLLTWLLLRLLVSGYVELSGRQRRAVIGITLVVGALAYTLGKVNDLFLTCEDFTISGNSEPPDCGRGPSSSWVGSLPH